MNEEVRRVARAEEPVRTTPPLPIRERCEHSPDVGDSARRDSARRRMGPNSAEHIKLPFGGNSPIVRRTARAARRLPTT